MAPVVDVDPASISSSGWGVIFEKNESADVREALEPLLSHRGRQAGSLYREYSYLANESSASFLSRHGAGPGPADPSRVPYYLLIVGGPERIGFTFQSHLDVQYGVGRICFNSLDEYRNYANTIVDVETNGLERPKRTAFFGVQNRDDTATKQLLEELLDPLSSRLRSQSDDWEIELITGEEATKKRLSRLLHGGTTPAFLFTGAHGLVLPPDNPEQTEVQGAIICSDWKGQVQEGSRKLSSEVYFSGKEIGADATLKGMVMFAFNCFSVGTPESDSTGRRKGERQANKPFIADLPQRLLGHPKGGALAVIGNIDRAWTLSWNMGPEGPQIGTYISFITKCLRGEPIGHAMEYFNQRYAELATQLVNLLEEREHGDKNDPSEIARLRYATVDAQNFVVFGDPAVRLSFHPIVDDSPSIHSERRDAAARSVRSARKRSRKGSIELGGQFGAINDEVSTDDHLGYRYYVEALADLIMSPNTRPPLTIGVFGAWGIGKTFLLHNISREVVSRNEATDALDVTAEVIGFNAWEYSVNEEIWPGLVGKIMGHMEKRLPWGVLGRFRARLALNFSRKLKKHRSLLVFLLALSLVALALSYLLAGGEVTLALETIAALFAVGILKFFGDLLANPLSQKLIDLFKVGGYGRHIGIMEEIATDLHYLDKRLPPEGRVLVVVDDLDRCEPTRAVEMLQAIKLLLDFKRFVVLMGIDARIVGCAVEKHYEGLLGEVGASGYEYLDKIIQIPFQIPKPKEGDMEFFVAQLMGNPKDTASSSFKNREEMAGKKEMPQSERRDPSEVAHSYASITGGDLSTQATIGQPTETASRSDLSFTAEELSMFESLIPHMRPNPRHVKRVVNIYRLVRAIAHRKRDSILLERPDVAVTWVLLCLQWPRSIQLMLEELEVLSRDPLGKEEEAELSSDPLSSLFQRVVSRFGKVVESWGEGARKLSWLLRDAGVSRPDLLELRHLERYAIHFRPWVDPAQGDHSQIVDDLEATQETTS